MPSSAALLGIDLGTSAVKVAAHTVDGRELATETRAYGLQTPRPGWVEQDAEEVYSATMQALREVLDGIKSQGAEPAAIGFSAAMHGVLAVDERGEPISPLITWMDRRSSDVAEGWRRDGTAAALYERTGAPVHPMLPLCKLRWLARNDAALYERAARFVGMKELFVHRWTGEWLIDYALGTATGMLDTRTKTWDPQALDLVELRAERLSSPVPCATRRRITRPAVARALGLGEGTTVVLASSDGALANLGTGAVHPDLMTLTLGTSGAVRVVVEHPLLDRAGRTFCYLFDDSHWLVGGPTSSAGAVLEKIFELVLPEVPHDERLARAVSLAAAAPVGAEGVTLLPFLSGERAPYWRGDLRGALFGLDLAHGRQHILRAAFEGIVFALHGVYAVMRELGIAPLGIALSGGLMRAPLIRQMVADIFEVEARLPDRAEASAFGAAMFAGVACGAIASLDDVARLVRCPRTYAPRAADRAAYRTARRRFEARGGGAKAGAGRLKFLYGRPKIVVRPVGYRSS